MLILLLVQSLSYIVTNISVCSNETVRESGHDTTYRFDANCANLATIDLNSLIYKYETDLHSIINTEFGGS